MSMQRGFVRKLGMAPTQTSTQNLTPHPLGSREEIDVANPVIARLWFHQYEVKGIADLRKRAAALEKAFPIGVVKMWNGDDDDEEREVDGTGVIVAVTFEENVEEIKRRVNGRFGSLAMTCECGDRYECLAPLPTDEEVAAASEAMLAEIEAMESDLCEEMEKYEEEDDAVAECVMCGEVDGELIDVRNRFEMEQAGMTPAAIFQVHPECADDEMVEVVYLPRVKWQDDEPLDLRKRPMAVAYGELTTAI